jgi:hypothetical protein
MKPQPQDDGVQEFGILIATVFFIFVLTINTLVWWLL